MTTDFQCPVCGAEFDLSTALAHAEDQRALARLAAVSIPIGSRVFQYIALFAPAKQRLTMRKRVKLLLQLLPGLEKQSINFKGRDWAVPIDAWAQAIDQMLEMRDAGRLELPMKGHGYLYAILAGMADKHEAKAERQREEQAGQRGRAHSSGAPTQVGQLLGPANATPRVTDVVPGLVPLPRTAAPAPAATSPTVRAMREAIAKKKGAQA